MTYTLKEIMARLETMDNFDDLMEYHSIIKQDLEAAPQNHELHYCNILVCSKMNALNAEVLKDELSKVHTLQDVVKQRIRIARWLVIASAGMLIIHLVRLFL